MYLISTNSSMPWSEPSRPRPDSLTPPKGATSVPSDGRVDADHAVFQLLGDAEGAAEIRRVEIGGEAEGRVVGERDDLVLALEAVDGRDGPKVSSRVTSMVGGDAGEHRRLVEGAAERMALAADHDLGALGDGVGDMALDLLDGAAR
jgi:hypothetical protein